MSSGRRLYEERLTSIWWMMRSSPMCCCGSWTRHRSGPRAGAGAPFGDRFLVPRFRLVLAIADEAAGYGRQRRRRWPPPAAPACPVKLPRRAPVPAPMAPPPRAPASVLFMELQPHVPRMSKPPSQCLVFMMNLLISGRHSRALKAGTDYAGNCPVRQVHTNPKRERGKSRCRPRWALRASMPR